jgi:lycopene beta-cyclase
MHEAQVTDIAIIGGGLAGLSLALHLQAQPEFNSTVDIFEPRVNYKQDRHWCFFSAEKTLFDHLSIRTFDIFSIGKSGQLKDMACARMPYRALRSEDVYRYALQKLHDDPRFRMHLGRGISTLQTAQKDESLICLDGDPLRVYRQVFDSRLNTGSIERRSPQYRQWFYGAEIRCAHSISRPVLMDFQPLNDNRLAFFYLLPIAADRLLVQYTCFLISAQTAPANADELWRHYIKANVAGSFEVLAYEHGEIPMHVIKPVMRSAQVLTIGSAAGWVRASTGYGFLDTQRACARLAESYVNQTLSAQVAARSHWDDRMDAIFLSAIEKNHNSAIDYFIQLFAQNDCEPLLRFLSGTASLGDRLSVMRALPAWPFLSVAHRGVW